MRRASLQPGSDAGGSDGGGSDGGVFVGPAIAAPSMRWAMLAAAVLAALVSAVTNDAEGQRRRRRRANAEGQLVIQVNVEGAEILVDEESVGFAPLDPISLSPGSHTVRVRRPGYTEYDDVVQIRPGQQTELPVDLLALSMVLTVRTVPDEARVFVDDGFRGTTPLELELVEGEHTLRVTAPGYEAAVREVTATPGETNAIDIELEAVPEELLQPRSLEWYEEPLTWIIGGSALAAVALVIIIAVAAAPGDPYSDHCGSLQSGREMCDLVVDTTPVWTF